MIAPQVFERLEAVQEALLMHDEERKPPGNLSEPFICNVERTNSERRDPGSET